jgi:hypothetical protein
LLATIEPAERLDHRAEVGALVGAAAAAMARQGEFQRAQQMLRRVRLVLLAGLIERRQDLVAQPPQLCHRHLLPQVGTGPMPGRASQSGRPWLRAG